MTESGAALVACLSMEHITTGFDIQVNAENHLRSVRSGDALARLMRTVNGFGACRYTRSMLEWKGIGLK